MTRTPRLLLTGASGFIGRHLLPRIGSAYDVVTAGRTPVPPHAHVALDLAVAGDAPRLPAIDQLVHSAALTKKTHEPIRDPQSFHRVNVQGTGRLLRFLESAPLSHVVYVSTCDVYAACDGPIDERSPTSGDNPYSRSKLEAEAMVARWCDQRSIPCAVVRLGNIYGPGDEAYGKLIPVAIRKALAGEPITIVGAGQALRDVLHVSDVARAIATVAAARADGIFNCVSGQPVTVRRICERIDELSGNPAGLACADPAAPESHRVFAVSRLASLGWRPRVPLDAGLASDIDARRHGARHRQVPDRQVPALDPLAS